MADKKISALTGATTPLAGTEVLPIVQGGSTVKVSVDNLTVGKAVSTGALTSTGAVNFNGGTFRFNSAKADYDFNVSGDADDNLIYCDASTDQVGFGRNNPGAKIDVEGSAIVRGNVTITGAFIPGANISAPSADAFVYRSADNTLALGTANAARVVVDVSGNTTVNTGNLVVGTAGKGIDFSANGGDVLTQYDEGTWNVTWNNLTGTPTSTQGRYTRIGRMVFFSYYTGPGAISGTANSVSFSLPFTPAYGFSGSMIAGNITNAGSILIWTGGLAYPGTFSASEMVFSGMFFV